MKHQVQDGLKLVLTAPGGGVADGVGYVIGNTFVVAEADAAAAASFVGCRIGVFSLAKNTSDAITEGAQVFWDNTAKECRAASATGRFLIGTCTVAVLAAATRVNVALNGISVVAAA